jgi:hypothetical protein
MRKKIDNNDLTHYFIRDHRELPASYLKSCEKFFDEYIAKRVREAMHLKPGKVDDGRVERERDKKRIAEQNANIQRVDAQTKGVKW